MTMDSTAYVAVVLLLAVSTIAAYALHTLLHFNTLSLV